LDSVPIVSSEPRGNGIESSSVSEPEPESLVQLLCIEWRDAGLKELCHIEKFLSDADAHILHGRGKRLSYKSVPEQVAGGKTQVGKTGFKALISVLAKRRRVTTIIVTTTRDLRKQIICSLTKDFFSKLAETSRPLCMSVTRPVEDERSCHEYDLELQKCMRESGVVVVNCTKYAIDKICSRIAEFRGRNLNFDFVLIKDESDSMSRTFEGQLQLEMALDRLTGKRGYEGGGRLGGPLLILNVSATLLPVFLRMRTEGKFHVETTIGKHDLEHYSGLDSMEPVGGVFLLDRELRRNNEPMPYWCDKVDILYTDAHPADPTKQGRGVLLLDAVNSRVTAEGNTRERANWIQRRYPRFTAVVVWGSGGVTVRFPSTDGKLRRGWLQGDELMDLVREQFATGRISRNGRVCEPEAPSRASVSDVLSAIICLQGIDCPVAVFGYSRMLRGESFRSSCVAPEAGGSPLAIVPTHILCGLGERQSYENLVQMLGRATGTFRAELAANGHKAVRVLASWQDFDAACAYLSFQEELARRLSESDEGLEAALGSLAVPYASQCNFLQLASTRSLGNAKMRFGLDVPFEEGRGGVEGRGRQYAEGEGMPLYGPHGQLLRLESPLPAEERARMTEEERRVEAMMYHSRYHCDPKAIVIRSAATRLAVEDVWQDQGFWDALHQDVPVLVYRRDGSASVRRATETFHAEAIRRPDSLGLLFQWRRCPGAAEGEFQYSLHESILRFVDRHRLTIAAHPPITDEAGLLATAASVGRADQLQPACSAEAPSESGRDEGALSPPILSRQHLAALLAEAWNCESALKAAVRCFDLDPGGFNRRCVTKSLSKNARLEILCAGRSSGSASALLEWLAEVQQPCTCKHGSVGGLTREGWEDPV
jgi:hypothetical protein